MGVERSRRQQALGVSQTFVRRFTAIWLICLLCLIAITGARIILLRERGGAVAVAALQTEAAGPPAGLVSRMDALLVHDQRWQAVVCYGPTGALQFGGLRTSLGISSTTILDNTTSAALATVQVRAGDGAGRCEGLVLVLDSDEVYSVIRDTALAAIALLSIGALALLTVSIRSLRGDPQPLRALAPPPGLTPDTAGSSPADPASGTTRRIRHGPH